MGKILNFFNAVIDAIADEIVLNEKAKVQGKKPVKSKQMSINSYVPRNYIEQAIQSIASNAISSSMDSYKYTYCEDIMKIVKTNWNNISDFTKTYAIAQLRNISSHMTMDSHKRDVGVLITKIAIGNFD